jgi:hypothetical protein
MKFALSTLALFALLIALPAIPESKDPVLPVSKRIRQRQGSRLRRSSPDGKVDRVS